MLNTVLFDLDGTLLPMDQDAFLRRYFELLCQAMAPHGYQPDALVEAVEAGTEAMFQNDGSRTNEERFWAAFQTRCGRVPQEELPHFQRFYEVEFQAAVSATQPHPLAARCVAALKEKGYTVALATNPVFPAIATESRMRWAGLNRADFALVTTYENSRWCKPHPAYYREILHTLGKAPEECLMIGNDVAEDMVAAKLGMRVKLLTHCLLHAGEGADLTPYAPVDYPGLLEYVEALPNLS